MNKALERGIYSCGLRIWQSKAKMFDRSFDTRDRRTILQTVERFSPALDQV